MDYYVWKQLLKNLVLPPTGPLLLAGLGLALVACRRARLGGAILCAVGLAALWVLATPIAADSLYYLIKEAGSLLSYTVHVSQPNSRLH